MINILKQALKALTLYAVLQMKMYTHEAMNRVRRFSLGAFFVIISFVFWLIGFVLLFLALFFHFAGKPDFVLPGVWTALISMGVGLVITISGVWMTKKKSHQSANILEDGAEKQSDKEFGETFTSETEKLIDTMAAEFKKCVDSLFQGRKDDGKKDDQKGSSWLNAILIFVIGFIAGIVVSSIKRTTDQSGNISETHSNDKPNDPAQQ
jgi:hypothetical protein